MFEPQNESISSSDGRYCVSGLRQASSPHGIKGRGQANTGHAWRWLSLSVAASLLLRLALLNFESLDYRAFLSVWYDSCLEHGRWHAIGEPAGQLPSYCYPPLYLYLVSLSTLLPLPKLYAVKAFSVAADYLAAWYVWRLARLEPSPGYWPCVIVGGFLFLPTVVMNSALWGQCDMMYTCGLLASLFYLLKGRSVATLIAFGVSCSLKPQAIFWGPFLAGLLASRRVAWKHLWIPVGVYVACAVPAMLAGWPVVDALTHWGPAAINPMALVLGAPNWYQWVPDPRASAFYWTGVSLTMLVTGGLVLRMKQGPPEGLSESRWLISMALLSVLFPPFFLPGVHERYFFAADVLSVVYGFCFPRQWIVALLVPEAIAPPLVTPAEASQTLLNR